MIQAAVDAVDDDKSPPPPELRLYWLCMRYGALPEPGALFEQDAGLLSRMSTLGSVYDSVSRIRGLVGKQIHNMKPEDGRMWAWLEELGIRV